MILHAARERQYLRVQGSQRQPLKTAIGLKINVLISVLITLLVVVLVPYLVTLVPIDGRPKQIANAVV
jgi:hypothetical protein